MSTYRKDWECCESVIITKAWEPEECPFCKIDDIEKDFSILVETFKHVHVNNGVDDDCKRCGLDLRHQIHLVEI